MVSDPEGLTPIEGGEAVTEPDQRPLHRRIVGAPVVHDAERAAAALAGLLQRCEEEAGLAPLGGLVAEASVRDLLTGVFGASPYLTSLIERDPEGLSRVLSSSPEER